MYCLFTDCRDDTDASATAGSKPRQARPQTTAMLLTSELWLCRYSVKASMCDRGGS